jgi:hypothetical protein
MIEHRAAVSERLVDQEAGGLRKLNLGRDQILDRLWELANLSSEATRGSITGQVKALSMIVAIEGLIPSGTTNGRRPSPSGMQQWPSEQQRQPTGEDPGDAVAPAEPEPVPQPANGTSSPYLDRNEPSVANPFVNPEKLNRVPAATNYVFDAVLDKPSSLSLSFSPDKLFSGRRR